MKQIIQAITKFFKWVKFYLWDKPISKPEKDKKYVLKATEVAHEYMVVTYRGQRINMLRSSYPVWKASSRYDKRATMQKFAKLEKEGQIKFVEVEGNLICVANKDYQARADKKKEAKHGN